MNNKIRSIYLLNHSGTTLPNGQTVLYIINLIYCPALRPDRKGGKEGNWEKLPEIMHDLQINGILKRQQQYKIWGSIFNDANIFCHIKVGRHTAPCWFLCCQGINI